jgi:hypothetical protein
MNKIQNLHTYKPEYELEKSKLKDFFLGFIDKTIEKADSIHGKYKYMIELQKISNKSSKKLEVLFEDLEHSLSKSNDQALFEKIQTNTKRYITLLYEVIDSIMPTKTSVTKDDEFEAYSELINNQRKANLINLSNGNDGKKIFENKTVPPEVLRK